MLNPATSPLTLPLANGQWGDPRTYILLAVILCTVSIATVVGVILSRRDKMGVESALVRRYNDKVRVWWMMCVIFAFGFLIGRVGVVVLFGLVSFWALREFITMTPTRRGDHRALFWVFFVFTPLQYVLIGLGPETYYALFPDANGDFYGLYSIMIPVYASLFIPFRTALSGDDRRFLERIAKIQFGLLVCVYALSYAPALLYMRLNYWNPETGALEPWQYSNVGLLFYFVVIVQVNDVMQFIWDKMVGRKVIAPTINSTRTWEGFFGAAVCTSLVGMLIPIIFSDRITPFQWFGSGCMALVISVMGFAGSITMSAIKRDRGVKDYGTLVTGHAGVLDRIDSVCFAAPVFYHVTRIFLEVRTSAPAPATESAAQLMM